MTPYRVLVKYKKVEIKWTDEHPADSCSYEEVTEKYKLFRVMHKNINLTACETDLLKFKSDIGKNLKISASDVLSVEVTPIDFFIEGEIKDSRYDTLN